MVDGVGTNSFTYTAFDALLSEDGPWNQDAVSYTYDNGRRRSGLSLAQPSAPAWAQSYAYDGLGRLTNITSPAGSFGYGYRASVVDDFLVTGIYGIYEFLTPTAGSLVESLSLPNGASITNGYDLYGRLTATNLRAGDNGLIGGHEYEYNEANRRTRQTLRAGPSPLVNQTVDYTYDLIGQLKEATGREAGGAERLHEKLGYAYDQAGNLNYRTNNGLVQSFGVNNLNELTTVGRSGTYTVAGNVVGSPTSLTVADNANPGQAATRYADGTFARAGVSLLDGNNTFTAVAQDGQGRSATNQVQASLPASTSFSYDLNGNLLSDGQRAFAYDDENQLVRITVTGAWKSEFAYDGKLRRRVRTECAWSAGGWVTNAVVRYVYDGNLVVQERDGLNVPQVTYTRGKDLSGSLEGAGGIGGLLARTDQASLTPQHAYYFADGNGNVTTLVNAQQAAVARYLYDPFGNLLASSGPLAEANLYRFSSKEFHANSGLVYYLYRYYEPNLQRWLNCDPIGIQGGINLFGFVANNPVSYRDAFGWQFVANTETHNATIVCQGEEYRIKL